MDTALSGRLADSCVASQGSLLGKGQGLKSMSRIGNCDQFGEVFSNPDSLYSLSGDQDRVADFPGFSVAEEFLPSKVQSAKFWRVLLGHLVPGGQLRMRALQLALK